MEIDEVRTYPSPNIFSVRQNIVKMKVRLGEYAEIPTKDIKNLNDKILEVFPGIYDHKCSKGYVGGFVDRLREGTYLAHVVEHLCLELQRTLGYDLKYGKARQVEKDTYNVIFACQNPLIGKECGLFIVNWINHIIHDTSFAFEDGIRELRNSCIKYSLGPSTRAIVEEAAKRGIPVSELGDSGVIRLGYGRHQKYISATLYEGTSCMAVDIACDKSLTKMVLDEVGIPVPAGRVCLTLEEANQYAAEIGYPIVVKPKSGNQGKKVFVGVSDKNELKTAFLQSVSVDKEVLVERCIRGRDYRLLVVNGKTVAAAERIPAHVIGDGEHTIQQLIEIENRNDHRGDDHEKPLTKIKMDENTGSLLEKHGFRIDSIPGENVRVWLKETANLSTGGIAIDCTDHVHPKNREIAELAAKTIGLDIAGIDMVMPDVSNPIDKGYGAVVEVNAAPGIRMHLFPTTGESKNVAAPVLDMIFPEGQPFSAPIISITGTNGKTTTTRMIGNILRKTGVNVGVTTTHGIYINDRCVEEGDTTGPRSARRILNDRSIDVAVLETARGGIVREGLAYQKADVAVFTNLSEDHLGIDEIRTMEELLHVKSLVLETVKDTGACVLNADDPWVMKAYDRARGNIILYSLDNKNAGVLEHLRAGGSVVLVNNNTIYISSRGIYREIMKMDQIPATLGGVLKHNIYNALASIGACFAAGVPFDSIRQAMSTFSLDVNPGRFNICEMENFKVVLDYGHNIEGYRVTIEGLKKMGAANLIGIIGVPGDRRDEDIKRIGYLAGQSFDKLILKEDHDLRGRKPLEVCDLLKSGVLESRMAGENIEIIPDEEEALQRAILQAQENDVIVVFFEKMEPLVDVIQRFRKEKEIKNEELQTPLLA